jgi:hypothetical protein
LDLPVKTGGSAVAGGRGRGARRLVLGWIVLSDGSRDGPTSVEMKEN